MTYTEYLNWTWPEDDPNNPPEDDNYEEEMLNKTIEPCTNQNQ
jgi:hypothetical protein